jgi:outer membrane immunogenic protein
MHRCVERVTLDGRMRFKPRNRIKLLRSEDALARAIPVFPTGASEVAETGIWGTMKKIVLATVLAALASASALAADLGPRAYTKAPMMAAPVSSWQGFYIGGNVGYGWGDGKTDFSFLPTPLDFGIANATLDTKSKGALGGAQIGYNWQMGSLVTGFEVDIQGSGIKGKAGPTHPLDVDTGLPLAFAVLTANHELSWFGTVRGRLGFAVTPDLLLYGTAGLAYGQTKASANADESAEIGRDPFRANVSKTKAGWAAGAGGEWMFARNWSAKLEYLFVDLGKTSETRFDIPPFGDFGVRYTWHTQENIVRAGVNYHF